METIFLAALAGALLGGHRPAYADRAASDDSRHADRRGLFGTLIGWIILVIYGLIQVGVFFLIRRIARIEV